MSSRSELRWWPIAVAALLCACSKSANDQGATQKAASVAAANDGMNSGRDDGRSEAPHPHRPSGPPAWQTQHVLRICADPNNLPFSNQKQQGFENKLAEMMAHDIGATVSYLWFPQRRGFIRHTLRAKDCDVVMGVPAESDMAEPTQPYYRSTYVFVTRRNHGVRVTSLDDSVLHHVKIGVHIVGDDYANPPAVQALARRGIVSNVVGYSIYGDYSKPDPPADLVRAVARGDVDVAIVWGPFAGYFAQRSHVPLTITPVPAADAVPGLPFAFSIAAAGRHGDSATHTMLEGELVRRRADVQKLLHSYGIPMLALPTAVAGAPPADARGTHS